MSSKPKARKPSEIMKATAAEVRENCEPREGGPLGPEFIDETSGALFGGPMFSDPDFDFGIFDVIEDGTPPGRMMDKGEYEDDCPCCEAFKAMDEANGYDVD